MKKAMIFAAGLGTRLKPLTDNKPKALVEVNGMPLIEIVIKQLIKFGFTEIIINVHYYASQIIDFVKNNKSFGANIHFSDETDKLLGTGGGLKKAEHFFNDEPFLVHNVDIISDIDLDDLYNYHINNEALATLAVRSRKTSRYFLFDDKLSLCGWKNFKTNDIKIAKPPLSKLTPIAFSGIQIISPEIFQYINNKSAFSITDIYITLAGRYLISAYKHDNTFWMDIGKPINIVKAEKHLSGILK